MGRLLAVEPWAGHCPRSHKWILWHLVDNTVSCVIPTYFAFIITVDPRRYSLRTVFVHLLLGKGHWCWIEWRDLYSLYSWYEGKSGSGLWGQGPPVPPPFCAVSLPSGGGSTQSIKWTSCVSLKKLLPFYDPRLLSKGKEPALYTFSGPLRLWRLQIYDSEMHSIKKRNQSFEGVWVLSLKQEVPLDCLPKQC